MRSSDAICGSITRNALVWFFSWYFFLVHQTPSTTSTLLGLNCRTFFSPTCSLTNFPCASRPCLIWVKISFVFSLIVLLLTCFLIHLLYIWQIGIHICESSRQKNTPLGGLPVWSCRKSYLPTLPLGLQAILIEFCFRGI